MKHYPSITRNPKGIPDKLHIFDKLDGSNLRFEWSLKRGWYKSGTRTRLFDASDPIFGPAIDLFNSTMLGQRVTEVLLENGIKNAVIFCEYWGKESFAGNHEIDDPKFLTLLDVTHDKKGFYSPDDMLELFHNKLSLADNEIPAYYGRWPWDQEFIQSIRDNTLGITSPEGVVGKAMVKNNILVMRKAKTQVWIDKVRTKYSQQEAERLILS